MTMQLFEVSIDVLESISRESWVLLVALIVYITQKFFVPQILELRDVIKRARYAVSYYANVFPVTKEDILLDRKKFDTTSKELRIVSAKLRSCRDNIPLYGLVARTGIVPKWRSVENAAMGFMGWSNEIYSTVSGQSSRLEFRGQIAKALNMKNF